MRATHHSRAAAEDYSPRRKPWVRWRNQQAPKGRKKTCSRIGKLIWPVACALVSCSFLSASDCIPIHEVAQHIGETKCVTGKVLRIKLGAKGVHFLDFCEDQVACPFSVVVFGGDLKDVGDVRRLIGRTIEIHGAVKTYDGRPEIILRRISQITGGAAMIPPLPKNYDVENRGHFSAGRLYPSKKPAKTKGTVPSTATYGDVEGDEPP
jgi:hypothetical protein